MKNDDLKGKVIFGCDFGKSVGFDKCSDCPIDCDIRGKSVIDGGGRDLDGQRAGD